MHYKTLHSAQLKRFTMLRNICTRTVISPDYVYMVFPALSFRSVEIPDRPQSPLATFRCIVCFSVSLRFPFGLLRYVAYCSITFPIRQYIVANIFPKRLHNSNIHPTFAPANTGIAQLVEHRSPKPSVGSSSLSSRAKVVSCESKTCSLFHFGGE